MIYEVVYCTECQKPIKSVPSWLASVDVRFSCDHCRQKHPKPFSAIDASPVDKPIRSIDDEDSDEVVSDAEISFDDAGEEMADEDSVVEDTADAL